MLLRFSLRAFTALAWIVLAAISYRVDAAGRVFHDDFESGSAGKWTSDGKVPCKVVSSALDGLNAGNRGRMAECNWNGTVAWNDPATYSALELRSWDYDREFLIRFRVRYASDVDRKVNSKLLRLSISDTDRFYMDGQLEKGECASPFIFWEVMAKVSGPKQWGSGQCLGDLQWHSVEIYVSVNQSVKVWVDDVLQNDGSGVNRSSARWQPLFVMSNWSSNDAASAHDANNHVYWDDFEIFSDTGTGATGLLSEGTATHSGSPELPEPPKPEPPKPTPPQPAALSTVEAIAYRQYNGNNNRTLFERVGTINLGVACTKASLTMIDGVTTKNMLPSNKAAVLDAGKALPKQIWAKCDLR